ncbi:MAG: DNA polymerase III subunit alpha, partial [Longimicrobiales bacterium]
GEAEDVLVTQWDMNALEQAGMLKMDFLGLKTLTVIHEAVAWIRRRHGSLRDPRSDAEYARIEDVPLDDAAVYEMLAKGGTIGVFQFESSLATDKLRAMRCDRFEDLVASNALIRPGPLDTGMTDVFIRRKLGKEAVRYAHPKLEEVLEPTYGVITYQEQVMRIAQVLAGFTLAEADVLRKAVGKKDADLIQTELERFRTRAIERGVDRRTAQDLAEQIMTFGRYGFNRSHSVAYALLSYQTAWLKRHYPAEFMAALLSSVVDRTEDVVKYIAECRELGRYLPERVDGLRVLPPDVNESEWKFTPVSADQIRFGLGAVRGLGEGAVGSILRARRDGPFSSLFDLAERIDLRAVGKRALEALIQAGALDSFAHRAQLMAGLEAAVGEAQLRQQERETGQHSLFDGGDGVESAAPRPAPQLPAVEAWPETERLAREKEILGFFISGHPLERFRDVLRVYGEITTATLAEHRDERVELPCVVTSVARQFSKRDASEYGKLTVEDFHGTATVLVFGETWEATRHVLVQDAPVLVRGQVSGRERDEADPPIRLYEATPLAELRASGALGLELELAGVATSPDSIDAAAALLRAYPGAGRVYVHWGRERDTDAASDGNGNGDPVPGGYRLRSRSITVTPDEALVAGLRDLFGPARVTLVRG